LHSSHAPALEVSSLAQRLNKKFVLVSSAVLLLVFITFVTFDHFSYRSELASQVNAITQVAANNSQGALSFMDKEAADSVLLSLQHYSHIRHAALITPDFSIFSQYNNNWLNQVNTRIIPGNIFIDDLYIEIYQPIIWDNEVIGHLFVVSDLDKLSERKVNFALLALAVLSFAWALSLFLSRRIIRKITQPIYQLVDFVTQRGLDHDYEKRAPLGKLSEINTLVNGVNSMLSAISHTQKALKVSEERLSLALIGGGEGLWDFDLVNNQLFLDKYSCAVLGMSQDQTILNGQQWHRMIHPKDLSKFRLYTYKFIEKHDIHYQIEFRVQGEIDWVWLKLLGEISHSDEHQVPQRMTGTLVDITAQRTAEEQIKLYASVFDNTSDAIVILNSSLNIIAVNQSFSKITKYSREEMDSQPLSILHHGDSSQEIQQQLRVTGSWSGEVKDKRKDGSEYVLELALNTVTPTSEQEFNYIVAVFSDITERKQTEDELFFMANYDALTKLPNRAMFSNMLNGAIASAKRNNSKIALLFIDLDKFKQVNDTLGHDAGDELLIQSAQRFKSQLRATDNVARLAGDEFTIILEDINDSREIYTIASAIQKDFQRSFDIMAQTANIGTSIGISIYPNDGDNADKLLKNADTAMYFAKTNGRNSFHFFDQTMNAQAERRNLLEFELRQALENNQIRIHYQPKIDTSTMKVWGFEALARWEHPTQGEISPFEFIPIAEEAGLIREIGLYVFERATIQLQQWHTQGYVGLHMAVNVSAREFQLSDYPIEIAKVLNSLTINAKFIELELTESIVMENPQKMTLMLDVIKNLGLSLSIDDFGTGYSSLSYLQRLPVDVLKVDQSFVRDIEDKPHSASIAKAIISMAHSLGLTVVAEGVETKAQLEFFIQQRCALIQGYYFSKPLPVAQAQEYLQQHAIKHPREHHEYQD